MKTITVNDLQQKLAAANGRGVDLIDVRTGPEYREVHVTGARNLPLQELDPQQVRDTRSAEAEGPTYVLCKSGQRSVKACEQLAAAGVEAVVVEGGTEAAEAAGLPVERGKKTISLERQVRIAAGALVAVGTLLGALISPWWLIVPAFVGCGLVFAGVTDTCGMGMMLAKMPWNR